MVLEWNCLLLQVWDGMGLDGMQRDKLDCVVCRVERPTVGTTASLQRPVERA